jgi:YegS/Rv2252/BmrU family lipid kinase
VKSLFLVNAKSGTRRKYDVRELIRETCSDWTAGYEILASERKEDLDAMIDDAERNGFEIVYAVGGDGTVHEIAKRLIGRKLALGILPTGSGNGFARHIGLPLEPRASLRACNARRIVTIDTAIVNDMPFLGVMGIGFDAVVADRFANAGTRGLATYVKVGARAFFSFAAEEYEIEVDGRELKEKAFVIAIANSGQYGNDARIAPLASLQDGLLDLVIVAKQSLPSALSLIVKLFRGTVNHARGVTSLQGKSIRVRRAAAGPAHLDGEPLTLPAELNVRVVPQSLRILLPDATTRW